MNTYQRTLFHTLGYLQEGEVALTIHRWLVEVFPDPKDGAFLCRPSQSSCSFFHTRLTMPNTRIYYMSLSLRAECFVIGEGYIARNLSCEYADPLLFEKLGSKLFKWFELDVELKARLYYPYLELPQTNFAML